MTSDWQRIENALKDGTIVDLWCKRSWKPPQLFERSVDMYWCNTHNCWRRAENLHFVDHFWQAQKNARYLIPVYWMLRPEPPEGIEI